MKIHGGAAIHARGDKAVASAKERLESLGITPDTKLLEVQKAVGVVNPLSRPPLFTEKDILRIEQHFQTLPYNTEAEILPGIQLSLSNAGHVPGSAMAFLKFQTGKKAEFYSTLFSGDLGRDR